MRALQIVVFAFTSFSAVVCACFFLLSMFSLARTGFVGFVGSGAVALTFALANVVFAVSQAKGLGWL